MRFSIEQIWLHWLEMPLVHFFETSFGRTTHRRIILVEVASGGVSGWGEVTCGEHPHYNEEWTEGAWLILRDYLVPEALGRTLGSAAEASRFGSSLRGHRMARGGLEAACWDLDARLLGQPLWKVIGGGARREIPCGVSIGIQDTVEKLIEKIRTELSAGYRRIKIKIKPGWDVNVVEAVRREFPSILLMADANSAYTLADAGRLQALDLSPSQSGVLWAIRLIILGVAVAAVWQAVLAPWARQHPVYRWSGWYLVLLAALCAALGIARHGIVAPPPGLALLLLAAGVFLAVELLSMRVKNTSSTPPDERSTFGA